MVAFDTVHPTAVLIAAEALLLAVCPSAKPGPISMSSAAAGARTFVKQFEMDGFWILDMSIDLV